MEYIALYRKWRPMTFDEVVEQDNVVRILKNTVKNKRVAHAYLFCGTRGTGKTTLAKIFSRAINCQNPVDGNPCNQCEICKGILSDTLLDVSEIDAASNNGVDNIRGIIDDSAYSASKAEYKVFIIDEVHMLTTAAFNALLKTLEEPPENVVFILATTEPHKLPVTILSRCQRYDFKRISRAGIVSRLAEICDSSNIEYEDAALSFIAGKADGALRDAISLLDQTLASVEGPLTTQAARLASGSLDRETVEIFAEKLLLSDGASVLTLTDKIFSEGRDPSNFICELMDVFRSMLVILSVRSPGSLIYESGADLDKLRKLAEISNVKEITMFIKELSALENSLKYSVQRKIIFESGMLSICDRNWDSSTELTDRMQYLEERVSDLTANGLKMAQLSYQPMAVQNVQSANDDSIPAPTDDDVPFEDAPKPKKPEKKEYSMNDMTPVGELDWKDFISAISDHKKPSLGNGIKIHAKGYIVGSTLYVVFRNESMMGIVYKPQLAPVLKECAQTAFGAGDINVSVLSQDEFVTMIPDLKRKELEVEIGGDDSSESFDKSLDNLKALADEQGFTITTEE